MNVLQFYLFFGIFVVNVLADRPTNDTNPGSKVQPKGRFDYSYLFILART